jgi:hypothetical protein
MDFIIVIIIIVVVLMISVYCWTASLIFTNVLIIYFRKV